MSSGEIFSELPADLKQKVTEAESIRLPRRGIIAVYHILLMKDAIRSRTAGQDPQDIISK